MQDSRTAPMAIVFSFIVICSTFVAPVGAHVEEGGTIGNVDTAPDINITDTTINVSTETTIQAAYNATGTNSSHLEILLETDKDDYTLAVNRSLSTAEGVANLTIPADAAGPDFTANVSLINNSTGTPSLLASDTANFTVTGAETDGLPAAPYVNATDRPIDPTVTSYVYVAYDATGSIDSANNVSVAIRNESSGEIIGRNSSLSHLLGTANISIPSGEGTTPFPATVYLNNSSSGNTIETDIVNYTSLESDGAGGGPMPVSLSENVSVTSVALNKTTVNESEDFEISVSLKNSGNAEETVSVSPMAYKRDTADGTSVSWSTTKSVPAGQTVNATLIANLSSYGGYDVSVGNYRPQTQLTILADGPNVVLRDVYDNQVVVANEPQSFLATVKNYGNEAGHGNLSMELGDGTVLAWYNTSTLAPGKSSDARFQHTFTQKGEHKVYFNHSGGQELMNITVRESVVTNSSFKVVSGPNPDENLSVSAGLNANQISIRIQNASDGNELDNTGVTAATKFRINVTVKNFTSRVLIGSARNASWERTPINSTHTRLTIVGNPAEVQYMENAPSIDNWPTNGNDRADYRRNLTVDFSAFALNSYAGSGGWAERINGTLISTDAQTFGTPQFNASANNGTGALELEVAAPHLTVSGQENDGFYEAQLPQNLLDHWGVTDVSTLEANYQGGSQSLEAISLTDGGAKVTVPIHYSSGTVSISPSTGGGGGTNTDSNTTTEDTSTGNGVATVVDTDDEVSIDSPTSSTPGTQDTPSSPDISVSVSNGTGNQSVSASVTNAKANSTVSLTFAKNESSTPGANGTDNTNASTTALEQLNVSLSDDADFEVSVNASTAAPPEAADAGTPEGANVVSYVELGHNGLTNEQVSGASLTFRVNKDRFGEGFDPANAVVYRLHDGEWTELDTTLVGETETNYRLRAASPGLSVFAVGQKSPKLTVESTSLSTETAAVAEDVTVNATISNEGTGKGEYTAELAVDGEVVTTKTVTVPPGETVSVSLWWEFGAGGEYDLSLGNATVGTVTVQSVDQQRATETTTKDTQTTTSTPGLGIAAGLISVLVAGLIARQRD